MKKSVLLVCSLFFPLVLPSAFAQDYEVNGGQPQQAAPAKKSGQKQSSKKNSPAAASSSDSGIGWGNSIEVGRLARAAQDALKRGNPAAAADFAQRAVKAAPQNSKLWLLLGYTSRLAGRTQQSIDAYTHALQTDPKSLDAKSGLAQTYMRRRGRQR